LKILIHRGANEIGGTCIQLSTDNTTILLDLGLPLSKGSKHIDISALKPDAVLISHPHQDHFGLIDTLDPGIPVFIGELGKNLIDATRILIGKPLHTNYFRHFKSWKPFAVGAFTVTPYLVDHSAVDAYGFLIEAEGKRVFYSGDFRAHGRKSVLFDNMIKNPPKDIDLLFMEGTMMQRDNDKFPTESDVEHKIFETIKGQENITFLLSSSQNIDRIVSAFRACKRAGKTLVIDIYTAWVLEQLKLVSNSIPSMEWEQVKVYTSFSQDNKLKEHPEFFGDFRNRIYQQRVHKEELQANPDNYLFFGKMSHFKIINLYKNIKPVNVIYSQWLGYLSCSDDDYYGAEAITGYQDDPQVNFVYAHTSGHATVGDLQKFAKALRPKKLVPIHTEIPQQFIDSFDSVQLLEDGCVLDI
jgi:ribonuclease J